MELLRADLLLGVELADGKEETLTVRNVNSDMTELYVSQITGIMKNTFEIKGQHISSVKSADLVRINKKPYALS